MPTYVAFLRGVSPSNTRMPDLRRAFEAAGFGAVRTLGSSGNVVFEAGRAATPALERRAEAALAKALGRPVLAFVRPAAALAALLESDPYGKCEVPAGAKRVMTFLRGPAAKGARLPVERDGARVVTARGAEAFSAYLPSPRGPVFMALIEETFGDEVTTRSWDTVAKAVREAGRAPGARSG